MSVKNATKNARKAVRASTAPSIQSFPYTGRHAARRLLLLGAAGFVMAVAAQGVSARGVFASDLPTGGHIVGGAGSISQSGQTMTITQDTASMAANWHSFSIGTGHTVNFVQPSSSSVALNRVLGSDASVIHGSLNANGQVFLVNPNGVLFSSSAQVDVGGLVASTLDIAADDFMTGRYTFAGGSGNAIINQGNIRAANGGTVALIAATIINTGSITANEGAVLLGAGSKVTVDMGGPVKLEVEEGAIETLIEQGGAIRADGGRVYMTAKAAGDLASSVINHTGITEARTLATGKRGEIVLMGDMKRGRAIIAGRIDASAPDGGDGGFIETSAAQVETKSGLFLSAGSAYGAGGTWLIDPYDYVIDAVAAGNIVSALDSGTNVIVTTQVDDPSMGSGGNAAGLGDITVASAIEKTGGAVSSLTLRAANSIIVNAGISSTGGALHVTLDADNDNGVRDGAGVIILNDSISTNGGNLAFGTGATEMLNGVSTLVGGDVYVGGAGAISLATNGGQVDVHGEMLVANPAGLNINTSNGNVTFHGLVNSGNAFTGVYAPGSTWSQARTAAQSGTGLADGHTYLATIMTRLENAIAGRAVNYEASWLGGRRVTGLGTDDLWRWVVGPESAVDGGVGRPFSAQDGSGTGAVSYNGGYVNWDTGQPNNNGNPDLSLEHESVLMFSGTRGLWTDQGGGPNAAGGSATADYYVRETNLAPSSLSINAGAGQVTFNGAVGGVKALSTLDVTAGGIAINGGQVVTTGAQNYHAPVTLGALHTTLETIGANTDFVLNAARSITSTQAGAGSLILRSRRGVVLEGGSSINAGGGALNVTLWGDSDVNAGGYIWLKQDSGTGASINTNGGNITLSGGANPSLGYAEGVTGVHGNGVTLDTATLNSQGGNIVIRGTSAVAHTNYASSDSAVTDSASGVRLHGSNLIDSGTGTINMVGIGISTTGTSDGIETNTSGYSRILSAATGVTAITLWGDATGGTSLIGGRGVLLQGGQNGGIVLGATGANGGINLSGYGRSIPTGAGLHIEPNAHILSASGPINFTGIRGVGSNYQDVVMNGSAGAAVALPAGFGASPVTTSTANINFVVNSLGINNVLGDGVFADSAIRSNGILTFRPRTNGTVLKVQAANPADGSLWIPTTHLFGASGLAKTGFSQVVFGDSNTGNVTLHNYTFDNDTRLITSANLLLGDINIATQNLYAAVTGVRTITDIGNVIVGGLQLTATNGTVVLDSVGNAIGRLAALVNTITVISGSAMSIDTVGAMHGVTASDRVELSTINGDLTIAQNLTTTLTTSDAMILNAGRGAAAGTITGGNIIVSGTPTISTGAGGRAIFMTGSIAGSTSIAARAGAGRYRYNSDEAATNYVTPLGAGLYVIYREAPVVTIDLASDSRAYDGTAYSGGNGVVSTSGFVNGDDISVLSGSINYSGTAQGAINAGTYTIGGGGFGNGVGYTIQYTGGELVITKLTLTYVADPFNVDYGDPIPPLTGTVTGFIAGEDESNATTGSLVFTTTATQGSYGGSYAVTGGGLSADNYDFVQAAGNTTALTIVGGPPPPPPAPPVTVPEIDTAFQNAIESAQSTRPGSPLRLRPGSPGGDSGSGGRRIGGLDVIETKTGRHGGFNIASTGESRRMAHNLKVFIVDGGVRLPYNEQE